MNKIALCIPAYNAALYLPRLLTSAKEQLIPFDEIWVYDDCSTDNTAAIAEAYGAKVIRGDINRGCSSGKNILAEAVSSTWIHFHDADDDLKPNFTTLAQRWISSPACPDIVLFDYESRDYHSNTVVGRREFDREQLESDPVSYAILEQINPFCGLYNRKKFLDAGGYDTDPLILYNEDVAFHIKMAVSGLSFSSEAEISVINNIVNNSMSRSNLNKCLEAHFHVLDKYSKNVPDAYFYQVAIKLWRLLGPLAAANNWAYVKKVLILCNNLGYKYPVEGGGVFGLLTKINPYMAVWLREKLIRILKPALRKNE